MKTDLIRHAERLAEDGRAPDGAALLHAAATNGDGDAAFQLARWCLGGRHVPRDLSEARDLFSRAADNGHTHARTITIAFLAHGIGGQRYWPEALRRLGQLADANLAARSEYDLIAEMPLTSEGDPVSLPPAETLTSSPSVVRFSNLLSPRECRYLIDRALPLLKPSSVVDPRSGRLVRNPIRTSDAAAFPLIAESPAIHAINRRFAAVSATDARQGEPLQILRYRRGEEYRPHIDALARGGNQRSWTLLAYLNEDYDGGETHFPALGLSIRANTGDAVLFANALDDGFPDQRTIHAGLPVRAGEKFVASRWIRAHPLDLSGRGAP